MFQESLDRQEKIPEETLNTADDSPTMDDNDRNTYAADYSLLGFWRALESYLVIESDVQADTMKKIEMRRRLEVWSMSS